MKKWLDWARNQIQNTNNGGYIAFPEDGAVFQVNKDEHFLTLICCLPTWTGSEVETINKEVFARIGYEYIIPKDLPTDPESAFKNIMNNYQKYAANMLALITCVETIFKVDSNPILKKLGKKVAINPVTIRGNLPESTDASNLSISRIWVATNKLRDGSHKFNPGDKRIQWDKPVGLLIWGEDPKSIKGMATDDENFIAAVKQLKTKDSLTLSVWGEEIRNRLDSSTIVFDKVSNVLRVTLYSGDNKENLLAVAVLDFDKFIEGLGHLFPNGELE